eukprot:scaffold51563_cov63-Phaeocystis_antarctica.AAC.3
MGSGERGCENIATPARSPLCVHRQAEFHGMKMTVFYPGSGSTTSLDNNLWLPDIVTYAADTTHAAAALHGATLPGQDR